MLVEAMNTRQGRRALSEIMIQPFREAMLARSMHRFLPVNHIS